MCVQSVYTDIVDIVALFFELNIHELWFEYGTGKYKKILPIHAFANNLTKEKCNGLLFWYAFTGCDTDSSFAMKGKSAAWNTWNTWNSYEESMQLLLDHHNIIMILLAIALIFLVPIFSLSYFWSWLFFLVVLFRLNSVLRVSFHCI